MNSEVKAITNEFTKTANQLIERRIPNQIPIPWARSAIGRRKFTAKLIASIRSSRMLLMSANKGASGKAATNIVTKPNWITKKYLKNQCCNSWVPCEQLVTPTPNERETTASNKFCILWTGVVQAFHGNKWNRRQMHHVGRDELAYAQWKSTLARSGFSLVRRRRNQPLGGYSWVKYLQHNKCMKSVNYVSILRLEQVRPKRVLTKNKIPTIDEKRIFPAPEMQS